LIAADLGRAPSTLSRELTRKHRPSRRRGLPAHRGEAAGRCADAVDLTPAGAGDPHRRGGGRHSRFKGYPNSAPGRRSLPGWLVEVIRVHTEQYGYGEADLMFGNEVGAARRRTAFKGQGVRPPLDRADLLGAVLRDDDHWVAAWIEE
jgi:hypothetical protein